MRKSVNCDGENLRELSARVIAMRELLDERDTRYSERDAARLKAVESAFAASKEAITKAEDGQKQYNATHNDLARKMDAQYQAMIPRSEADIRFKVLEARLSEILEARSEVKGRAELSTPLLLALATGAGALILFFIQRAFP